MGKQDFDGDEQEGGAAGSAAGLWTPPRRGGFQQQQQQQQETMTATNHETNNEYSHNHHNESPTSVMDDSSMVWTTTTTTKPGPYPRKNPPPSATTATGATKQEDPGQHQSQYRLQPRVGSSSRGTETSEHQYREDDSEAGRVIAIGIPKNSATTNNSNINMKNPPAPRTTTEATQLALSQAVAETLAEQEHKQKQSFQQVASQSNVTVVPRTASTRQELEDQVIKQEAAAATASAAVAARRRSIQAPPPTTEAASAPTKKAPPAAAAASASAAFAARAQRTSLVGSQQLELQQTPPPAGSVKQAPPAAAPPVTARGHRYSVRGAAAEQQQARGKAKEEQQHEQQNVGPSLALSHSASAGKREPTATPLPNTTMPRGESPALAMAPKMTTLPGAFSATPKEDRTKGKQENSNHMNSQDDNGPSLAPARASSNARLTLAAASGSVQQQRSQPPRQPVAAAQAVSTARVHCGSAVPPVSSIQRAPEEITTTMDWSALVSATPSRALVPPYVPSNEQEDMIEATVGLTVRPGAFAIQGMGARRDSDDDDDLDSESEGSFLQHHRDDEPYEDGGGGGESASGSGDDPSSQFLDENRSGGSSRGDPMNSHYSNPGGDVELGGEVVVVHDTPLQAELYERELVEANIVVDDEDELANNPKLLRRLRIVQALVLLFSLAGIACVIVSAVTGFGTNNNEIPVTPIPVISGWVHVGGTTATGISDSTGEEPEEALVLGQVFGPHHQEDLALFGSAVALSSNGQKLVATAPGIDQGNTLNAGETAIFEWNKNNWQVAHILPGLTGGSQENPSASLSIADSPANGSNSTNFVIAVGYPFYPEDGRVQIWDASNKYQSPVILSFLPTTNDQTEQMQENMVTAFPDDISSTSTGMPPNQTGFGYSVDLSPDGTLLAVSAPLFESEPNSVSGCVRVYQKQSQDASSSSWVQVGGHDMNTGKSASLFKGLHPNELFGWDVALRNNRLAVGGPAYDTDRGLVRVLEWDPRASSPWKQIGKDIIGSDQLERFGESVALSDDGTVLAIGARGTAFDAGRVQVFRLGKNNAWVADDHVFVGQEPGDGFGASVALSSDGTEVVIGAPQNSEFGKSSGQIQVWQYQSGATGTGAYEWIQLGSSLGATAAGANLGNSVALSWTGDDTKNGKVLRVVGGAPGADFDGSVTKAGSFFAFDRQQT